MKTFTRLFLLAAILYATTADAQYCLLPGRTAYSSNQPGITNFKLRNINRTSSNVENPLSEPSMVVTTDSTVLERGKTYVVTITHSHDAVIFPTARNNIRVWLDYDQNQDFTGTDETIITKDYTTSGGVYVDSFTVPMTAKLGVTRLRATAKMSSDAGHTVPTPCDIPKDPIDYHGEMEDYTVTIVAEGTGINDIDATKRNVDIYPNPSSGNVTISFADIRQEQLSIELYDITGKQQAVLLNAQQQQSVSYNFNLDNYNLAQGIYFIKITSGDAVSFERLIMTK